MRVSLFRNRVWIASLLIAVALLALDFWPARETATRIAMDLLVAVALGQVVAWIFSLLLAKRIRGLNTFTEGLLDAPSFGAPGPLNGAAQLPPENDELGILNRSLHRMSTRIRDLVGNLSLESARRDSILSSMAEGVLAVDNRLQVIFCNDALARILGARPPVAAGTPVLDMVRDPVLVNLLTQTIASGESAKHKIQLSAGEGKSFQAQAAPLAMPERRGAIVILHDITDIERLERVRKDFVANVSHELRTPLTAIRGYAETLLSGALADTENNRRFVEIIQAHAIRLNNIAADLMVLSELESGRPAAEPEPVSVRDAVETAISTVESEARVREVALVCPEPPDLFVLGHKLRLEQALVNLLDNAVKFNRPHGEARIDVSAAAEGTLRIVVSDTGSGIPSADVPRIFERFYRVDKARSRAVGGTGLGLSIVKHAIERMNGSIRVDTHLGRGSAFTIVLPQLDFADAPGPADDHQGGHAQEQPVLHDADRVV